MKEKLEHLASEAERALSSAADKNQLLQIKTQFLGRSGQLTLLIKQLGTLPGNERPAIGQLINQAKHSIEQKIEQRLAVLTAREHEAQDRKEARRYFAAGQIPLPREEAYGRCCIPVITSIQAILFDLPGNLAGTVCQSI